MTIQFRPVDGPPREPPEPGSPDPEPWLPPAGQVQTEEALFHFLQALLDGRYQARLPLLLAPTTLHSLYRDPHPSLVDALHHNLDALLIELHPDVGRWPLLQPAAHIWGVALAAHNCLLPHLAQPVLAFTRALIQTIPPARSLADLLAYHAVLVRPAGALADWPAGAERTPLLQDLLNRSPLTALYHLQAATPPPLTGLAASLLRWWQSRVIPPAPWANLADWLAVLTPLLTDRHIATYLHHRWLNLPEERAACRNLGLLLEALRQQAGQRDFILTYYNAYAYTTRRVYTDNRGRQRDYWPGVERIERLLRPKTASDGAALSLARLGSEHFLKFWPLVQLVAAEGQLPGTPYRWLNQPFVQALAPLVNFASIGPVASRLPAGPLEFLSEDAP